MNSPIASSDFAETAISLRVLADHRIDQRFMEYHRSHFRFRESPPLAKAKPATD
jgi:hypothetical protein